MENEVSGIAKLGIVLIALAVLIGLGFGIFQISKSVANDGVGNVQKELDGVSSSQYTTYDQKVVTGTTVTSAIASFNEENTAVLLATQSWVDLLNNASKGLGTIDHTKYTDILTLGSGLSQSFASETTGQSGVSLPIVWAKVDSKTEANKVESYKMEASDGKLVNGAFINYNSILGGIGSTRNGEVGGKPAIIPVKPAGTSDQKATINGNTVYMAELKFDNNCYRCTSGYATGSDGKVLANNLIGNISKTGRTEYVSSGAKFESYLVKDNSGTIMGVTFQQIR